jgi:CheY-like chemotaxis protein
MDGMSGALRRLLGRGIVAERRVLATMPHAVLTVDQAERLVFANPAAVGLLTGILVVESADLNGASLHGAIQTLAADGGRVCALCVAASPDGEHEGDATIVVGHTTHRVRYAAAPLIERDRTLGLVVMLERRRTDAEIERRNEERIAREMQSLLADLAHELNNPLTVILAGAGMLREADTAEITRRRIELIGEAAERCVAIVRTFRSARGTAPVPPPPGPPAPPPTPVPARILVVDDDPRVASAMAAALAADGHHVEIAHDGAEALSQIVAGAYDAILTDVRMPRLDGPGLYRELRRLRPELLSRVVFVTADMLSTGTREFIESTGAPVVRKPFEPPQLRTAVRRLLAASAPDSA